MSKRNVFIWHVIIALIAVVAGMWLATDYVARAYRFHPALGRPWFVVQHHPIYAPWSWLLWDGRFGYRDAELFKRATGVLALVIIGNFVVLVAFAVYRMKHESQKDGYGTSRWATDKELKEAGLLAEKGIVLAQTADARLKAIPQPESLPKLKVLRLGKHIIRLPGATHAFVFAPTRSGKGVGIVIPTLVTTPDSLIAWDIKGELWNLTAGWRRQFSHVLRFEPASPTSVRYNPLAEIRQGEEYEVRDTQAVATMILDTGEKAEGDHWIDTGKILLTAAILHVLYAEPDKTLHGVASFLSDPSRTAEQTLDLMLKTPHLGDRPHPLVAWSARNVLSKSENEMSGVFSTATARLGLYMDPMVARATSASDFRIMDLQHATNPVSLYLIVPPAPAEVKRLRPLIRLMLDQFLGRLTEKTESGGAPKRKHDLLCSMDEFPTLGRMDVFEVGVGFFAGYGIRCLFIAQGTQQIDKLYTKDTAIPGNCFVKVTYAAYDAQTAKAVAEVLGETTHESEHVSMSGNRLGPWLGHASSSVQQNARALLTPGEIMQLPPTDALIITGSAFPYRAKKVVYYQDKRFKSRVGLPVPNTWEEQVKEFIPGAENPWDKRPPIVHAAAAEAAPPASVTGLVMPGFPAAPHSDAPTEPDAAALAGTAEPDQALAQATEAAPSNPEGVAEVRHDGQSPGLEAAAAAADTTISPASEPPAAGLDLFDSFSPSGDDGTKPSGGDLPL